jgi:DNA-binding CsgD family transcriptional regulator
MLSMTLQPHYAPTAAVLVPNLHTQVPIPAPQVSFPNSWPSEYTPVAWPEVWRRLAGAQLRFRSATWTDGKCVVLFRKPLTLNRQLALTHREHTVLLRTLRGDRQKLIALDARIAPSTVANCLKTAMQKLGFKNRLDAAPLAALLLCNSSATQANPEACTQFVSNDGEYIFASAARPDWSRFPDVTRSERQIAALIVEGKSNTEIAHLRDTSIHTVENQVASLFKKLEASGRFDLVRVLYRPATETTPGYFQ